MVCLISKSKAALHYGLLPLWVIQQQHKKKVFPIFGCKQINQLSGYSKFFLKNQPKNPKETKQNKTQTQKQNVKNHQTQ